MRRQTEASSGPRILSRELREILEEEIATGRLAPGTHLDETELSQRFDVSRTPIREALIQLASIGLVEARPRRGAFIPKLTPERLTEMVELIAALEAMCGRLAARRMTESERVQLVGAHQACANALDSADDYHDRNEYFHLLIGMGSHNAFLATSARSLRRRVRPYRRLPRLDLERRRGSSSEHSDIVDAILSGDPEQSADLIHQHILGKDVDVMVPQDTQTAAAAATCEGL